MFENSDILRFSLNETIKWLLNTLMLIYIDCMKSGKMTYFPILLMPRRNQHILKHLQMVFLYMRTKDLTSFLSYNAIIVALKWLYPYLN